MAQEGLRPLNGNLNYIYKDLASPKSKQNIGQHNKAKVNIQLPFKEDFSYASTLFYPDQSLWSDSSTYVNTGYGIAPMGIGVATFDGLNKRGYPYTPNLLNMSQSLPADTLTSKPINVYTSGTQTLQPSDSVGLTFYYQARGRGDSPEQTDSLILDFYKPNQNIWVSRVWYSKGNTSANTNDTIFKRGFVMLDTGYLQDGFKFRFRNKATTAGNFDHWHLDYIYLNKNRSIIADTTYDDIAIGYVPTSFLSRYTSIPWQQYNVSEKASKNSVFIRNNNNNTATPINMTYEYLTFDNTSTLTYSYTGGANPDIKPFKYFGWSNFVNHSNPPATYTFNTFTDSADFKIKHYIFKASSADFFPGNDTVIQYQRFRNYYAFDDGSSEGGYYVLGQGGKMALKIKVNVTDTLRAVRIYFDPVGSINTAETYNFRINVYTDNNGAPGSLMYKDSLMQPKYYSNATVNTAPEYTLTTPLILSPGEYFIGFQQFVSTGITVGFDKNTDRKEYLFYDSGNGWTQSGIYGALMLRPVFGSKISAPVGITENGFTSNNLFSVYPNPSNDQLTIRLKENKKASFQLINTTGQILLQNELSTPVNVLNTTLLPNGVYFLILNTDDLRTQRQKIIIQH